MVRIARLILNVGIVILFGDQELVLIADGEYPGGRIDPHAPYVRIAAEVGAFLDGTGMQRRANCKSLIETLSRRVGHLLKYGKGGIDCRTARSDAQESKITTVASGTPAIVLFL